MKLMRHENQTLAQPHGTFPGISNSKFAPPGLGWGAVMVISNVVSNLKRVRLFQCRRNAITGVREYLSILPHSVEKLTLISCVICYAYVCIHRSIGLRKGEIILR